MPTHSDTVELSRLLQDSLLASDGDYSKIEDCPVEVVQMFMRELDWGSKLDCSLVSHFWRAAAIPLLFVHIRLESDNAHNHYQFLDWDAMVDDKDSSISSLRPSLERAAPALASSVRDIDLVMASLDVDFIAFTVSIFPALEGLTVAAHKLGPHHSLSPPGFVQAKHSIQKLCLKVHAHRVNFTRVLGLFSHIAELKIDKMILCNAKCCSVEAPASRVYVQALVLSFSHTAENEALEILDSYLHSTALTSIDDRTRHGSFLDLASQTSRFPMVDTVATELYCNETYKGPHTVVSDNGTSLASFPRLSTLHLVCNNTEQCLLHMQNILQPLRPLCKLELTLRFMATDDHAYHYLYEELNFVDTCLYMEDLAETFEGMQWKLLSDGIAHHIESLQALDLHVRAASLDPQEEVEKTIKAIVPPLCSNNHRVQQLCTVSVDYVHYSGSNSGYDDHYEEDYSDGFRSDGYYSDSEEDPYEWMYYGNRRHLYARSDPYQ